MTEVIRVAKDPRVDETVADNRDEPVSETPQKSEVIRVLKVPAAGAEPTAEEAGQSDSEKPQPAEVRKVGKDHAAADSLATLPDSAVGTSPAATAISPDGVAGHALNLPSDVADDVATIARVFVDSLEALDSTAAEQANLLAGIAIRLAEAARSPEPLEFTRLAGGENPSGLQIESLVSGVQQAADTQLKAFRAAQGKLAEWAAGRKSDPGSHASSVFPAQPYPAVSAALANMVSNLNLAQQNAIANQQAMNSISQAAVAAGLNLLYTLTARSADGQGE
jgi:hypothetical protein